MYFRIVTSFSKFYKVRIVFCVMWLWDFLKRMFGVSHYNLETFDQLRDKPAFSRRIEDGTYVDHQVWEKVRREYEEKTMEEREKYLPLIE